MNIARAFARLFKKNVEGGPGGISTGATDYCKKLVDLLEKNLEGIILGIYKEKLNNTRKTMFEIHIETFLLIPPLPTHCSKFCRKTRRFLCRNLLKKNP